MGRRGPADGPSGLVVVDKPGGWTSHDVVARVRRLAGTRRVGHAGTLDPMATGVLVLGVGRATRLLTYLVGADKEYRATVRLGQSTTTDDAEGEVLTATPVTVLDTDRLDRAVADLTGAIQQVPSSVSAIKVDGRRAYARVRAGEEVTLPARPVVVHRLEVLSVRHGTGPQAECVDLDVTVECSSGTYVRALARDLGDALGVGGHLTALRRTRVGDHRLESATVLPEPGEELRLMPLADAARATFAAREVSAEEAADLAHGRSLRPDTDGAAGTPDAPVAAFGPDGSLVALLVDERDRSRPVLVLAPA